MKIIITFGIPSQNTHPPIKPSQTHLIITQAIKKYINEIKMNQIKQFLLCLVTAAETKLFSLELETFV